MDSQEARCNSVPFSASRTAWSRRLSLALGRHATAVQAISSVNHSSLHDWATMDSIKRRSASTSSGLKEMVCINWSRRSSWSKAYKPTNRMDFIRRINANAHLFKKTKSIGAEIWTANAKKELFQILTKPFRQPGFSKTALSSNWSSG